MNLRGKWAWTDRQTSLTIVAVAVDTYQEYTHSIDSTTSPSACYKSVHQVSLPSFDHCQCSQGVKRLATRKLGICCWGIWVAESEVATVGPWTHLCVDIAAAGASHEPPARIKAAALLAALPRDETGKCWQLWRDWQTFWQAPLTSFVRLATASAPAPATASASTLASFSSSSCSFSVSHVVQKFSN